MRTVWYMTDVEWKYLNLPNTDHPNPLTHGRNTPDNPLFSDGRCAKKIASLDGFRGSRERKFFWCCCCRWNLPWVFWFSVVQAAANGSRVLGSKGFNLVYPILRFLLPLLLRGYVRVATICTLLTANILLLVWTT